jgi:hypothetical protein
MDEKLWKIGDLAAATGLTVRTLHHYEEIGLLRPSWRTQAGYTLQVRKPTAISASARGLTWFAKTKRGKDAGSP